MHPETPYLEIGQAATVFYFIWFLLLVPVIGIIENTLLDLALENDKFSSRGQTTSFVSKTVSTN